MIKKFVSKALAVFAVAAAVSACGAAASAESYMTAPTEEPAAQVMIADVESDFQIADVDKEYIGSDDDYNYYEDNVTKEITKEEKKNWVKIILIALLISLVITGIIIFAIYHSYKYNGMTEPYEYKNKAPLELTEREDQLVDVRVTSRRINNDK